MIDKQTVILFDGTCNFCNSVVNFVIKRDNRNVILFAPLQTAVAHKILADYNLPTNDMKSFIFIDKGNAYTRSTAALKVCKYLNNLWPTMYGFIIIPSFIRDGIYDWIAKNRYKWFGQKKECMVPTPELQAKFLN